MTFALGSLLAGLALLIVVVVLVALPLLDRRAPVAAPPSPRQALEEERRAVVRVIRDLDFDFKTGKLAEEDYRLLRAAQVQHGAEVLRRLDALSQDTTAPGESRGAFAAGDSIDAEIEAGVEAAKSARSGADRVCPTAACISCGSALSPGDRYCARCGRPLQS